MKPIHQVYKIENGKETIIGGSHHKNIAKNFIKYLERTYDFKTDVKYFTRLSK